MSPVTIAAGGSRPMIASDVMDFPDPDSPTSPSTSPGAMENEKLRTATTGAAAFASTAGGTARPARDCGNSIVRLRTSSSGRTKAIVSAGTPLPTSTSFEATFGTLTSLDATPGVPIPPHGSTQPTVRNARRNALAGPTPYPTRVPADSQTDRRSDRSSLYHPSA